MPIGVAFPVDFVQTRRGPAEVFRLAVGGVDPGVRFLCVGRVFVELGEAAE
jgi:hypothetical protein